MENVMVGNLPVSVAFWETSNFKNKIFLIIFFFLNPKTIFFTLAIKTKAPQVKLMKININKYNKINLKGRL